MVGKMLLEMEQRFQNLQIEQIPRDDNQKAVFLAKIGSSLLDCRERKITVLGIGRDEHVLTISDREEDWRFPLLRFLGGDIL